MMDPAEIHAHQDRFTATMEAILRRNLGNGRSVTLLLSGGYDSFLVLATMRGVAPDLPIRTVTVRGRVPEDADGAESVAAHFGTDHFTRAVSVDEIIANLHLVRETGYTSMRRVVSHICHYLALADSGVVGRDVYSGHGGDFLYGNREAIYRNAAAIAADENQSEADVRLRLKLESYYRSRSKAHYLAELVNGLGGALQMPFRDPALEFVVRLPEAVVDPVGKSFARVALQRRYSLGSVADRRRIGMQNGSGLYRPLKKALRLMHPELGGSVAVIARHLCR